MLAVLGGPEDAKGLPTCLHAEEAGKGCERENPSLRDPAETPSTRLHFHYTRLCRCCSIPQLLHLCVQMRSFALKFAVFASNLLPDHMAKIYILQCRG
jgi:hypothetical protein